jgi:hypothetical protein
MIARPPEAPIDWRNSKASNEGGQIFLTNI